MICAVGAAFWIVVGPLDLPLCGRGSTCEEPGLAILASLLLVGLIVLLAVGLPVAWWRLRGRLRR